MMLYEIKRLLLICAFNVFSIFCCITCNNTDQHAEKKKANYSWCSQLEELHLQLSEKQPDKDNYHLYRELVNTYINDISNKSFELDSLLDILEIETMAIKEKNLFLKHISVYLLNIGKMDSAETVLRKIHSHPSPHWSKSKVELEFNGNMVVVKMGLNQCDSALFYVNKLKQIINSSENNFNAEEIRFYDWITKSYRDKCS